MLITALLVSEKTTVEWCGGVLVGGDAFHLYNAIPFFDISQALKRICAVNLHSVPVPEH